MLEGILFIAISIFNSWTPDLSLSAKVNGPTAFFPFALRSALSLPFESPSKLAQSSSPEPSVTELSVTESSTPIWLWMMIATAGGLGIGVSAYCFGRASIPVSAQSPPSKSSAPTSSSRKKQRQFSEKTQSSAALSSVKVTKARQSSGESTQITKIKTVETLIETLRNRDPQARRQAIWELGQQGTSEAIAPLVSVMATVDSQQRSLILGAISEIGIRTIQPLNRALVISLQDNNPDVRKNAIRDITRIYGLITQISQILCHAAADENEEVRTTAHWALGQFNQMYHTSNSASFEPSLQPSPQPPKSLP